MRAASPVWRVKESGGQGTEPGSYRTTLGVRPQSEFEVTSGRHGEQWKMAVLIGRQSTSVTRRNVCRDLAEQVNPCKFCL